MNTILFSPLNIRNITLKNRITVSPMCQYSSEDGFANDWHLVHLGSRAVGGAGLVMTEATAVSPEGRISPEDLGIWKDDHIANLKRITTFIEQQGSIAGIQLAHAGRKASTSSEWKGGGKPVCASAGGWTPVAPSAIPFDENSLIPESLTANGIHQVVTCFAEAADRAYKAGFKVIEIHAAHGYLIHEFLSPLSNKRTDEYGGSFENRIRLLLEIIAAVREVWPEDHPVFVRISATDWAENGWDIDQSVILATLLKNKGVDLIDVSSGGLAFHARMVIGYGYQLPMATKIKRESGILTGTVGLITDPIQAETILRNDDADLIFLGREFLRDPYFALHAANTVGTDTAWPVQYQRAKPR